MANASQTIHGSRIYLEREDKQVVRYSHRKVNAGINIKYQRRRRIQKKLSDFDTLCLLQEIKKITTVVGMKENLDDYKERSDGIG